MKIETKRLKWHDGLNGMWNMMYPNVPQYIKNYKQSRFTLSSIKQYKYVFNKLYLL